MILLKIGSQKMLADTTVKVNGQYLAYLVDDDLKQLYNKSGDPRQMFVTVKQAKDNKIKR